MLHYSSFKKSCVNLTGWVPVRSTNHPALDSALYVQRIEAYRNTPRVKAFYTISKNGKHLSSLFQSKPGSWFYGDTGNDALLVLMSATEMEIFLFEGQRHLAEALYRSVDTLQLAEVRAKARPVKDAKYERHLLCFQGKQLDFLNRK